MYRLFFCICFLSLWHNVCENSIWGLLASQFSLCDMNKEAHHGWVRMWQRKDLGRYITSVNFFIQHPSSPTFPCLPIMPSDLNLLQDYCVDYIRTLIVCDWKCHHTCIQIWATLVPLAFLIIFCWLSNLIIIAEHVFFFSFHWHLS